MGFPWDRCVETVIAEMQARQTPDVTSQAVGITMATAAAILLFFSEDKCSAVQVLARETSISTTD